jgi:hypothetical protein
VTPICKTCGRWFGARIPSYGWLIRCFLRPDGGVPSRPRPSYHPATTGQQHCPEFVATVEEAAPQKGGDVAVGGGA